MAKFDELSANSGVDTAKPNDAWVIVPDGGTNQVFLREADGFILSMKSDGGRVDWKDVPAPPNSRDPANMVASASRGKNDRLLKFIASKPGMGRIKAIRGGTEVSIGFSVHRKKTHKISFFFLHDQTGNGSKSRTTFTPSHAAEWVKDLSAVYGPQANIWFELGKAEPLPLAGLGEVVSDAHVGILAQKKDGVPINIFLAGSKINSSDANFPLGFYSIKENLIVVKDQEPTKSNSKPMLKTMAHEIAHLLNWTRKIATPGHDYFRVCGYESDVLNTPNSSNIKIPHQRVLDWNPW